MWHLGPWEELGLIFSSAAMLASCTVLLICWVMTLRYRRHKGGKEFEPDTKVTPYGTGVLSSVNLTRFSLDEIPEEGAYADQLKWKARECKTEQVIIDGVLVSRQNSSESRGSIDSSSAGPRSSFSSIHGSERLYNRQDSSYSRQAIQ